ncbi:FadR/GntR family transcriptional regulator [Pseudoalteromonas sp. S3431]|uniref:FadR/GntR family transcriptional regulator n=1 Tax=Pseudoalteromonas sp. S3431 TaxID=579537 RepID=UPI00049FFFB0|nr:FadR/GntR family transcriptional regulator [Pseudoalteromonas sp. S3431]KDC51964.1 GntR family transcriptional regulator [Pseudoalteromonas sp. S3431]
MQNVKKRRRFWMVVEKLEALIDQGIYPIGGRLPAEREMAEVYDVSRPTIREAIIALEVRKRVEVKTGSGVFVTSSKKTASLTPPISAFELTQARALVESEAAALAASKILDSELQALKQTLIDMEFSDKADEADQLFHEIIAQATRNKALALTINNFWKLRRSEPQILLAHQGVCSKNINQRLAEHTTIYDAIADRNPSAARKAMHNHFNRLINALFEASEAKALEEVRRKTDETRGLYSISHLTK